MNMYESSRMSGWSRALAIILGLFVIGVGFTAIFYPAIVVGFLTVLFAISFIMLGLWAVSMGVSGQRVKVVAPQTTRTEPSSRQPTSTVPDQGISAQSK